MHFSLFALALPCVMLAAAGCQASGPPLKAADSVKATDTVALGQAPPPAPAIAKSSHTATLLVHGMGCPQCANNVDRQLLKVPGVESVKVDMGTGNVTVDLSPSNPPTREQLAKAIDETGFTLVSIDM